MAANVEKIPCACSVCGTVREVKPTVKGAARTPKGWKNKPSGIVCGACQKDAYRLRAVSFMVGSVIEGGTWAEFLAACKDSWSQATRILNWATATLWSRDTQRTPDMEKCPPMPAVYLYGIANELGLHQTTGAVSRQALFQLADQRYRKRRYEVIWQGSASLPNATYPQPFPVPSANYKLLLGPDKQMRISLPLGGKRWLLELNGGAAMGSRKADFQRLLTGIAEGGQLDILETRTSSSARRKHGTKTDSTAGQKSTIGVTLKISGWFPKAEVRELAGTLQVRTDATAFIVACPEDGTRQAWTLHAQQITRAIARHRRWLAAVSDDRKFEKRKPSRKAARYNRGTGGRCDNHKDVIDNWVHESTRQLANLAIRLKMACVVFTKAETSVESFPWFVWESTLANKLDAAGIAYTGSKPDTAASAPVSSATP